MLAARASQSLAAGASSREVVNRGGGALHEFGKQSGVARLRRCIGASAARSEAVGPGEYWRDEGVPVGITHFRNGGGDGALTEIAADAVAQREESVVGLGRRDCRVGIIKSDLRRCGRKITRYDFAHFRVRPPLDYSCVLERRSLSRKLFRRRHCFFPPPRRGWRRGRHQCQ